MGLGKKAIRVNGAEVGVEAIMLGVVTSIGGFLFGYDTGQISAMLIFTDFRTRFGQIPQPDGTREFESIISALLVSLMSIGTLVGALAGAYTSEWFGRRKSIAVGIAFFLIGNAVQLSASTSWGHFTAGRVIAGLGVGNLSVGVPMYQSECCPREIRGAVVASYQLMITIGILVANGINYGVRSIQDQPASWRIVIGLGMAFSLPLGIGIFFVPESPRYLASRNDWEGARLSLGRLRGMKNDLHNSLIEDDYKEMRTVLDKESEVGTGGWLECFTGQPSGIPRLVYRTFLGGAIHFLQQWTGVNYFFYYGATIFAGAGISDPIQVALILGAVNVACTFPGLWMVERFGRRMPLFYGGLWQATWLAIFAGVGVGLDPLVSDVAANLMIVSACLFIASFASTWGPFAWVVIGESFPLRTRAKQASLATACNWLGNFMIAFFSPLADSGIGYNLGFVFMGCNFAAALIVYFFLYESRGLSLENTDVMYGVPDLKPWNSHKWVPDGYIDRYTRDQAFWRDDATRVNSEELGRPDDKNKTSAPQKHIEKRV